MNSENDTNTSPDQHRPVHKNPWFYSTLVCLSVLLFFGGMITQHYFQFLPGLIPGLQQSTNSKAASASPRPSRSKLAQANIQWIEDLPTNSRKKSVGDSSAPVTIVEYTDFKCPYCRRYVMTVFPKILKNYVSEGKVYYRIHHFPLTKLHPRAPLLANASECAADQNRFWEFRRYATKNIGRLDRLDDPFVSIGKAIEIPNMDTFRKCISNQEKMQVVEREWKQARSQGIKATPSFRINGKTVEGGQSYEKMKSLIEKELSS